MKYKLLVLDVDGTLLDSEKKISKRTQSETAKALHTTQVQISRRERKILIRLRTRLLEE